MLPGSAQNINKETSEGRILMSDPTEGCPRCRDYEDLKSELEDQKRESVEKQEDALKNCEASKKHLQKRLLQFGVAAVVAGTILGKEFVDKVASFIESFNKVVDVSPGEILSAAVTEQSPEEPPAEKEKEKEDKKDPPKKSVPMSMPVLAGYGRPTGFEIFMDPYGDTPFLSEALLPEIEMDPLVFSSQLIEDFQLMTPPVFTFNEWETIPFRETPTTMVVPAPGSLALLFVSFLTARRRRR